MHTAVLPFSTADLGWICLAAAVLLSTVVLLRLVVAGFSRRTATGGSAPAGPAPTRESEQVMTRL